MDAAAKELITSLREENRELKTAVERVTCQNNEQGHKIELLKEQINDLLRRLYGRKSERFEHPDQSDLFESLIELPEDAAAPPPSPAREEITYTRRRPEKRGPKPLPDHLERIDEVLDLPEEERDCGFCHELMVVTEEVIREELDILPPRFRVKRFIQRRRRCLQCMNRDVFVPFPARLIPRGRPSPSLLAFLIVSKYVDHVPLHRQEGIFKRHGIHLPRSTMDEWLGQLSALLLPIIAAMWRRLLEESYVQVDETPIKGFEPIPENKGKKGKKKKKIRNCYLWTYSVPRGEVIYDVTPTRSGRAPKAHLESFRGYVQTDGYSGYNDLFTSGERRRVACLAHIRRKFVESKEALPERVEEIIEGIGALFDIEREALDADIWGEERKRHREERGAAQRLAQVKEKIEALAPIPNPASKLGKAVTYALNQWPYLERYLEDGALEISNNLCENAIRPAALGRRNYLFLGSVEGGGQRAAVFYTILQSARRLGLEPFEYFRQLLERLPTQPEDRLDELTPARWLSARRATENPPA